MCYIVCLCVCLTQSCVGLLSEPKTLRLVMVVQYLDNLRNTLHGYQDYYLFIYLGFRLFFQWVFGLVGVGGWDG